MQAARDAREAQVDERRKLKEAQEEARAAHARKRALELEQICGRGAGEATSAGQTSTSQGAAPIAAAAAGAPAEPAMEDRNFELPEDLREYRGDPDDRCSLLPCVDADL